jgi:hypothetical protein
MHGVLHMAAQAIRAAPAAVYLVTSLISEKLLYFPWSDLARVVPTVLHHLCATYLMQEFSAQRNFSHNSGRY